MATRKLTTRMGLDEEVVRRLSNAGVTTCKDLFEQPEPQLMIILDRRWGRHTAAHCSRLVQCASAGLRQQPTALDRPCRSPFQVRQLLTQVASRCVPEIHTASTILTARSKQRSFLPTRMPTLDTTLGGGSRRRGGGCVARGQEARAPEPPREINASTRSTRPCAHPRRPLARLVDRGGRARGRGQVAALPHHVRMRRAPGGPGRPWGRHRRAVPGH